MILDVAVALVAILAFVRGARTGLVHSVLSVVAVVLGILVAMQLSVVVGTWLDSQLDLPPNILPILAFVLVVVAVVLAVRAVAALTRSILRAVLLGWIDRLAGGVLWAALGLLVLSAGIWLADRGGLLTDAVRTSSVTYPHIVALAPMIFDGIASVLPLAREAFDELRQLIEGATEPIRTAWS